MEIQKPKTQFSDLFAPIQRALKLYDTPQKLAEMKFTLELHLLMFQKLPNMYLSNREHSIQVQIKSEKSKPIEQFPLDPFNKIKTHYYMHTPKSYLVLNCPEKMLQKQPEELNDAYCPQFYFSGDKWEEFKKQRIYIKKTEDLDSIIISQWGLKIVNVSLSGHYGIVLEVYKSRRGNLQTDVKIPNITSIMYEQIVKNNLSKMRLNHVKRLVANQPENKNEEKISMCYHLRASKTYIKVSKGLQFVSIDNNGQILVYDKQKPKNYITVGDLQGMCSFPQSINLSQAHQDNQSRLNMQLQAYQKNSVISNIFKLKKQIQEHKLQKKMKEQKKRKFSQDSIGSPYSESQDQEGEVYISQNLDVSLNQERQESQSSQENEYFKKYREEAKLNKIK